MITGALILAAGVVLGWLLRSLPARSKGPKPVEAVCGCTHHYSAHDPKDHMKCNVAVYSGSTYRGECACLRYTGPEPLPSYFAPEIAGEAGQ